MSPGTAVIVVAKEPRPGRCKTRLCPPLAPHQAAELAAAALADTLETVAAAYAGRRVIVLDGAPGPWLPSGFDVVSQRPGALGERLAGAFEDVGGPALLVGMDTPQLTTASLAPALARLEERTVDAVLGPAEDGGYWAIGLTRPDPAVFAGVPMSSHLTLTGQRRSLARLGLRWVELETMRDFDTIEDARAVAGLCPGSRFAAALDRATCAVAA